MCFFRLIRPLIYRFDPETAHQMAVAALSHPFWLKHKQPPAALKTSFAGLDFNSPLGLAAGFDKNAQLVRAMQKLGFGFAEIGSVTPQAQAGNAKPRLFRLQEQEAIINRFGFNNDGLEVIAARLQKRPDGFMLGGNIGKNKTSEDAIADYVACLQGLYGLTDYITVNISSPNTPGLRDLQSQSALENLMRALYQTRKKMILNQGVKHKPIFVKIAPDLDDAALEMIADTAKSMAFEGMIIANTTLSRDGVQASIHAQETGGLSGKPLMQKSTEILAKIYRLTEGKIPLIGVGGIASAEDAYSKITHGASLVQLYSALIYQGFGLVQQINEALPNMLARDGFKTVHEAVGSALNG
jgi:dihydroorotate dehydrogenase